ncbi:MAG: L,D-transpeptidase [Actinobacteria bacterium]|nr:L,D-transpeptidase [Actinomycetota bacterium]
MNARIREILLLAVGLTLVLGAALGGYAVVRARAHGVPGGQVLAPVIMPTPTASGATPAPQYERWTVGIARRPITVRRRPADDAPVQARLPMQTPADYPTVVLVDKVREVDGVPWYLVWLPGPPNESRGWVRDGQMAFYSTASKIVIDLSQRKLTVYRRGELMRTFPVAVGRPGLETPNGHFFITQKLRPPDPNGVYGVLQLGTSATQPKLNGWPDGGLVAIHGTSEPWLIGKAISHGCVRMKNAAVQEVSRLVPTGSPVIIEK